MRSEVAQWPDINWLLQLYHDLITAFDDFIISLPSKLFRPIYICDLCDCHSCIIVAVTHTLGWRVNGG